MKTCNLCKQFLPIDNFHKGNGLLNVKSRCIICCKSYKQNSKTYKKQYYIENLDKAREERRIHNRNNKDKYQDRISKYDKTHKAEKCAREAFRRAQKLKATPPWLTKEHKEEIKAMYIHSAELSELTGIIHHVDHIMPLISKVVCGLHVPWNLQVIPAEDNLKKSNKVDYGLVR